MYTCEAVAVTAIRELGTGWKLMPYDDPERGLRGVFAFKDGREVVVQWPLFGRELEPDVGLCSASELLDFVQTEPPEGLFLADDPRGRLLGFVSYRRAVEGRSEVRRIPLTTFKNLPALPRTLLLRLRDVAMRSTQDQSSALCTIKPYGRIRAWFMRLVRRLIPLR